MSSNKKQKTESSDVSVQESISSAGITLSLSSPSSSSPVLIPEDVIREYILPYMIHLRQIDDVVKFIDENDTNITDVLRKCAGNGEVSAVHYIYSKYHHYLTNNDMKKAFDKACIKGSLKVLHYFCELKNDIGDYICDPSAENNEAIIIAACSGRLDMLKYLCEIKNDDGTFRCDPSDRNNLAISHAALNRHLNTLQYLCQIKNDDGTFRCDPSDRNNEAITWARVYGYFDIVQYLRALKNDDGKLRCGQSN